MNLISEFKFRMFLAKIMQGKASNRGTVFHDLLGHVAEGHHATCTAAGPLVKGEAGKKRQKPASALGEIKQKARLT